MKQLYLFALFLAGLFIVCDAESNKNNATDTLRIYHMDEVVVTSSTKETNNLRKLPGSVTMLSQDYWEIRIESVKDLSYVPNFFIPDYGSKMTSAVYIRGIGTRNSGQSVGLCKWPPYMDKSTSRF